MAIEARPVGVTEDEEPEPSTSGARNALEWALIVLGAFAVALVVKTFLVQAFFIPSLSMAPTLDNGDRVLVNKLSYDLHDVNRGDLVVFERPPGEVDTTVRDLIKRVVATEGETIEGHDGQLFVNGLALQEPYLGDEVTTSDFSPLVVPEDHVFVMGDNRTNSKDSRIFGPIDEDLIVGRAFVRVWPVADFSLL